MPKTRRRELPAGKVTSWGHTNPVELTLPMCKPS